jgi:hypothetical protein
MQKYKDVDGNIIKLKFFPFSLRGRAKDWWYVSNVSIIFDAPGLFLHHLLSVSL